MVSVATEQYIRAEAIQCMKIRTLDGVRQIRTYNILRIGMEQSSDTSSIQAIRHDECWQLWKAKELDEITVRRVLRSARGNYPRLAERLVAAAAAAAAVVVVAVVAAAAAAVASLAETTAIANLRNDNPSTASGTNQPIHKLRLNRKWPRQIAYRRKQK
ncbi:unnamed protein product [Toxocara canis]|uniref:Uncharacterized protein n=1 Tax=Toxocara canis TaxID=6265 RepID=A0A183V0M2_TOXCA|nr:unnamed protein product [Toxocara canis]